MNDKFFARSLENGVILGTHANGKNRAKASSVNEEEFLPAAEPMKWRGPPGEMCDNLLRRRLENFSKV